MADVNPLWCEC